MFAEIISLKVLQNHVVLPPFCSRDCHMMARYYKDYSLMMEDIIIVCRTRDSVKSQKL